MDTKPSPLPNKKAPIEKKNAKETAKPQKKAPPTEQSAPKQPQKKITVQTMKNKSDGKSKNRSNVSSSAGSIKSPKSGAATNTARSGKGLDIVMEHRDENEQRLHSQGTLDMNDGLTVEKIRK